MMHRLASLACSLLLVSCATPLPKGLTPKPDVRPVQASVEQTQESVARARESVAKLRESQKAAGVASGRVGEALRRAPASEAVEDAKIALAEADRQRNVSNQYIEWADTELANSWRYLGEAKKRITELSGQIDKAHENERVAVAAVEKWKPIIDQVNSYWGLGAFAYGFKVLTRHLFVLGLILAVVGGLLWFFVPAAIPVLRGIGGFIGGIFRKVLSIFTKK